MMGTFPFRNLGLKVLSICIALLLWLVVAGDRVVERTLRLPVEFQNLPAGLEIVGESPATVDARLRGPSGTLSRLGAGETAVVIDLRQARPGRRLFHLTGSEVQVPYGVEVVQLAPATLSMVFENAAVRMVQVRPSVEGRPAPGYEVTAIATDPAQVEVVGPESSLRGLDEAMTEPVDITSQSRPVREVVTIGVADPRVRLRTPQSAEVTVQIAAGSTVRTVEGIRVGARDLADGLTARLTPGVVVVTLRGTASEIRELSPAAVEASVDVGGMTGGEHVLPVQVGAPRGVHIERVEPESVRVRIGKS